MITVLVVIEPVEEVFDSEVVGGNWFIRLEKNSQNQFSYAGPEPRVIFEGVTPGQYSLAGGRLSSEGDTIGSVLEDTININPNDVAVKHNLK